MESNLQREQQQRLFRSHQPPEMTPGLTRFRSAPSSFFTNVLDSLVDDGFLNSPSSPETGRILSQLISGDMEDPTPHPIPAAQVALRPPLLRSINTKAKVLQQSDFSTAPYHQSSSQPPFLDRGTNYRAAKMGRGDNSSNLIRHSSSPAGLFSNINVDGGYAATSGPKGNLGDANDEVSLPPATRFGNHQDSLTRVSSLMSQMTPIAEIGDKSGENIQEVNPFGEDDDFVTGFAVGSWDDSDKYSALKRGRENNEKHFLGSDASGASKEDIMSGSPKMLAHHLSLSKSFDEMSAVEKLLQDTVPCKIRAKRGCATHPRSIAERVRRTKISERMRKLQDLVPNMDKQTNTADMLDLAVEYIKDLQQQVKMLSTNRAACACSTKRQS